MSGVKRVGRYPAEVRERAVRMVRDHEHEYPSQWKAIQSISKKLGVNHETLRIWVRRGEVDSGGAAGVGRPMSGPGSVSWSVRTRSCAGQTRS